MPNKLTVFIRVDVLSCDGILLIHLCLKMFFALLQHFELRSQAEDRILRAVLLLLGAATAKPAPDARHDGGNMLAEDEVDLALKRV